MGVTGLWRLIEPTGKPVPVETLENKVLAVDISIWLHQVVKGYQDAKGAPLPNAHLMGLFQRLCKLLYFRIKPIFVFDGAFPELKKETIARRQDHKQKYHSESARLKRELALILSKKTALGSLLGKQISPKKNIRLEETGDDLFKLPALPEKVAESESESESDDEDTSSSSIVDLHSVDLESDNFKNMPTREKYEVLIELKETRKMNSWHKVHELPKKSDNFSDFQLQRLLKRRKVQECLQETEKEMGSTGMSINDLESLLNDEGIDTKFDSLPTRRIASDNKTRYLLINNVRQAIDDAKNKVKQTADVKPSTSKVIDEPNTSIDNSEEKEPKKDELDEDLQKAIQMSLECVDETPEPANVSAKTDDSWTTFIDSDCSDIDTYSEEECDGFEVPDMSTAKAYILQYTDFTYKAIDKMVMPKKKVDKKKTPKITEILDDLGKEKPVIADNVDLSSGDEEIEEKNDMVVNIKEEIPDDDDFIQMQSESDEPNETVSSVALVDSSPNSIVTLNTSTDDNVVAISKETPETPDKVESESESSDGEFEEVEDGTKPVVELTLNIGDKLEDDIFADIFETEAPKNDILSSIKAIKSEPDIKITPSDKSKKVIILDKIVENVVEGNDPENQTKSNKECSSETIKASTSENINITVVNNPNDNSKPPKNENVAKNIEQENPTQYTKESCDTNSETVKPSTSKNRNVKVVNIPKDYCEPGKEITKPDNNKTIKPIDSEPNKKDIQTKEINTEKLNEMVEEIESVEDQLLKEKGRVDRVGRNITEQMTKDAQELLQIFGIPYIVAPMEAEAQCAFLESVNLTDGTITDDSDIWLFGGCTVYKNFFNQKKHVLQFLSERIEKSFNLSREQLILLAMLVGSDYTTGVTGVGPVTALEILASFPYNKKLVSEEISKQDRYKCLVTGLQEFKKWLRSGRRTDDTSLKKKLKNVQVTEEFPSVRVVQAYLEPNVEKSEDKFSWGELDITILRDYAKTKFGWSQHKLDEIVKPVLKRLKDRNTQKTLQDYFKRKVDFQSLDDQMSKRVKAAVHKMGPEGPLENPTEPLDPKVSKKEPRKRKPKKTDTETSETTTKKSKLDDDLPKTVVKIKLVDEPEKKSPIDISVRKTDRYQEVIPQREKDKQCLLQNKMKAIEIFRKTKMDKKRQPHKRKVNLPKEKAELSESDSD